MRMWSSSIPPPGRGSSWKYQSTQLQHSGPALHWEEARELGWMGSTRSCERMRRTSAIIAPSRGSLTKREMALFSPPSLCQPVGVMGQSMVAFLREFYGKEADKFLMSRQPALKHSWNTMVASSFWDMHLSIACAATDARTASSSTTTPSTSPSCMAQQPHPDLMRRTRCAP